MHIITIMAKRHHQSELRYFARPSIGAPPIAIHQKRRHMDTGWPSEVIQQRRVTEPAPLKMGTTGERNDGPLAPN